MPTRRRAFLSRLRRGARKLVSDGPRGWLLLCEAQLSILEAAWLVRHRPQGDLVRERGGSDLSKRDSSSVHREEVEAIALAIDRVARYGLGRPLCLVRSLALQRMLRRKGIPGSNVRVGVRMKGDRFEAHAWVEWDGAVVGDDSAHVASFRPFSELRFEGVVPL